MAGASSTGAVAASSSAGEQVVGQALRRAGEQVRGGGRHDDEVGLLAQPDMRRAPRSGSQSEVRTGRPVSASNVSGRTNSAAARRQHDIDPRAASVRRRAR